MNLINYFIMIFLTTFTIATDPPIDIVFIIQNHGTKHQGEISRKLKANIIKQSVELESNYRIRVHLVDDIFNYPGGWTILNLIPQLMFQRKHRKSPNNHNDLINQMDLEVIKDNTRWIVFCEDTTRVKLKLLMEKLNDENHKLPLFLGHPLYDREPTIIHHFAFFKNPKWFPYPLLQAGLIFSMPLLKSIADILGNQKNKHLIQQFSIDAGHELARFIYDNIHIPMATLTTPQLNNKNCHNNCYHHTCLNATSYEEKTTRSHSTFNKQNIQTLNDAQRTSALTHRGPFNIDVTSTMCDLSHSGFLSMMHKNNNKIFKPSGNKNTSTVTSKISFVKKQKIILKKAFYICPVPTGDTRSRTRNINKNNNNNESCAIYAEQTRNIASSMTSAPVKREEIYFAVKTCSKYHSERLSIIQATWAPYAKHIKYFSDIQDDSIPTTNTGVPNVEMGHCAKTLQILKLALRDIKNYNRANRENQQIQWLFLTDDDTLLSVSGVCEVLGCYNSMDEIYLGERYGYRLYAEDGFNYITGGGGIAFSLPVVKLILQHCSCPSPTAPDDMILGSCLHSLQIKALHSSRFHQARPNDYPLELLKQELPVSFHKFWQIDPVDVYNHWFAAQDRHLLAEENLYHAQLNNDDYGLQTLKLFGKPEHLNLNKIPVPRIEPLHHSKERQIGL